MIVLSTTKICRIICADQIDIQLQTGIVYAG